MNRPLLSPERAARILDEVMYRRVLECVDVAKLLMIEMDVWVALCDLDIESEQAARLEARNAIDRALARIASNGERYDVLSPFGAECPDCVEAIEESTRRARPGGRPSR